MRQWFTRRAHVVAITSGNHDRDHVPSCKKPGTGDFGCRFCKPSGHPVPAFWCVRLAMRPKRKGPEHTPKKPVWVFDPHSAWHQDEFWRCEHCRPEEHDSQSRLEEHADIFCWHRVDGQQHHARPASLPPPEKLHNREAFPLRPRATAAYALELKRPTVLRMPAYRAACTTSVTAQVNN